jgi:hypothetical protein
MGYLPFSCGAQRLTSSGVVSDSGKPVLVCGYGVESGSSATLPYFCDGTTNASPLFVAGPNTVSQGNIKDLAMPVMFPSGCYVSFDTNTTAVTVFYILQSVTN